MDWLNYHHLRYFWTVVKEGSITRASRLLHVSQPSISAQLRLLERSLGERLLQKHGRQLQPTDMGRLVQVYAEQIFGLGRELLDAVRDRPTGRPLRLQVGIADIVPKQLAAHLLAPARRLDVPVRLVVREDQPERLLAALSTFDLDLVISEAPPRGHKVKVFQHELGQSRVGVFGDKLLAAKARKRFPAGLGELPFLLPLEHSELRRDVDDWLRGQDLRLLVVGEFEDAALLQTVAGEGAGLMFAPTVLRQDLRRQHRLELVGELDGVAARYFGMTVERRIAHPAAAAILQAARHEVFGAAD